MIHSRVCQGPSKTQESTPSDTDTVLASTQIVVPAPLVQGPSPWILNRIIVEELGTIIGEAVLYI